MFLFVVSFTFFSCSSIDQTIFNSVLSVFSSELILSMPSSEETEKTILEKKDCVSLSE